MIVIDRGIDTVTPFCTQFSYKGQIDEYYQIDFNKILVPFEVIGDLGNDANPKKTEKKPVSMFLTPDDLVFDAIKDMTLDDARNYVSSKIRSFKELTASLSETKDRGMLAKAAKEKKFVKKYKQHLSIAIQIQSNLQKPTNFKLFEYEQVSNNRITQPRIAWWATHLSKTSSIRSKR